jgi:hypothetical protein
MLERSVFIRGLLVGSCTTGMLSAIGFFVVQFTGTAYTMAGELAEQWTAAELRKLRRNGWHLVNHFRLRQADIDHVLIGPGGVFAVETKWSSDAWEIDPIDDRLKRAVEHVGGEARRLRLWAEFKRAGVESVEPVVFLWGAAAANLSDSAAFTRVNGAVIVAGPRAKEFRSRLGTGALTRDQIEAARCSLEQHLSKRDELDPEPSIPPSVLRLIGVAIVTFAVALVSLLISLRLLPAVGSVVPWLGVLIALALAPLLARPKQLFRFPLFGWWAGLAAAAFLALTAVVVGV